MSACADDSLCAPSPTSPEGAAGKAGRRAIITTSGRRSLHSGPRLQSGGLNFYTSPPTRELTILPPIGRFLPAAQSASCKTIVHCWHRLGPDTSPAIAFGRRAAAAARAISGLSERWCSAAARAARGWGML
jgi:hypothetical protein